MLTRKEIEERISPRLDPTKKKQQEPLSPEERLQCIEFIAEKAHAGEDFSPFSESDEAFRLREARDKAIEGMDSATNRQERERAGATFLAVHKDFLRALGLTPCAARDCTKYLTGRQRRYCSPECRTKEKSRAWRAENPAKKEMANLKYSKKYEPDLIKAVKLEGKPKRR